VLSGLTRLATCHEFQEPYLPEAAVSEPEFDRFAASYREIHARNIVLSGESPDYFAQYKMLDFVSILHKLEAPRSGKFLDFGSGIGASVLPFLDGWPNGQLICADVSPSSIAQSLAVHGSLVEYSLIKDGRLAQTDSSVDGAFACCVFHHIPESNHPFCLRELRRVLKPGAPLMVYEHNPLNPLTVHAVRTCPLDENAVLIRAKTLRRRCEDAGFLAVRIEYRVFFPAALRRLRSLESSLRWLPFGAQYAVHARA